jgi:hypothetical protein
MQSAGRMTAQVRVRRLPVLGFQTLRHGRLLNFRNRESNATDCPVGDQAGQQCQ